MVVTGASSGIGRTIALRCAHEGAQVLASGRLEEALQELAAGAPAGGIRVHRADLTEPGAPEAATDAALSGPGRLDGVVHAAGTARRGEDIRSAGDDTTAAVRCRHRRERGPGDPAVLLHSDDSAWMTGQALIVDGGYTVQ